MPGGTAVYDFAGAMDIAILAGDPIERRSVLVDQMFVCVAHQRAEVSGYFDKTIGIQLLIANTNDYVLCQGGV